MTCDAFKTRRATSLAEEYAIDRYKRNNFQLGIDDSIPSWPTTLPKIASGRPWTTNHRAADAITRTPSSHHAHAFASCSIL